jgi:hypothetical protein
VEIKLDGLVTYLSCLHQIRRTLEGKNLDGYITGEMIVSAKSLVEYSEWRSTNSLLHTWFLNSIVVFIAKTDYDIEVVSDVWGKLMRIYAGIDNNMRVFQSRGR